MATTTSPPSPTGSTDTNGALIGSLISGAEGLLSSYYPSVTASNLNIATLTWPSTVVIDGSTMVVPETSLSTKEASTTSSATDSAANSLTSSAGSSLTSSVASSATRTAASSINQAAATSAPASTSASSSGSVGATATPAPQTDKRIGIAIGVSLGLVALGVLLGVLFLLHRRRRRTGSFMRHQPPPNDEEVDSWRSPMPSWQGSQSRIWAGGKPPALHAEPVPQMTSLGAPRTMIPAYMRSKTNETSSSDNSGKYPYYTPNETPAELDDGIPRGHEDEQMPLQSRAYPFSHAQAQQNRPSTPLIHHMMQSSRSPVSPIEHHQQQGYYQQQSQHHGYAQVNPFSSPDDYEADNDYYHQPMPPAKSPERRHSPQVHYPSGPELSNFDFGLAHRQQAGGWGSEPDIDGGDGWRRSNLSHGRHEMQ